MATPPASRGAAFVSEAIQPSASSFDAGMMSRGEPGLPHKFLWRKKECEVAQILESWKEHGGCTHGSGERYVRKHVYRVVLTDGRVLRLNFQRSFGRGKFTMKSRWRIHSIEHPARILEQGATPAGVIPFPEV